MYVVAGVTGRVGASAAEALIEAGAPLRVLVRRQQDAAPWERRGAQARAAALDDRAALTEALEGCTGFFVLLPFDLTVDDLDAHADALIASIAGPVAARRVPHVVVLSSGGADLPKGTGPISGLHRLERALLGTGATVTALRSGHFQEKVGDVLDAARGGVYPVFAASADVTLPLAATRDLGAVAARALLSPSASSEAVDVLGPRYTEREVATLLGATLGIDLQVVTLPEDAWAPTLAEAGFPPHVAASLAELYRADERGLLAPRGDRTIEVTTPLEATLRRVLAP